MRERDENKERAVRKAAIRLINELGFDGVSIAKIAKEANVSPATIYIYFENKEDMINKLYIGLKQEMGAAYFKNYDPDAPIKAGFKQLWDNLSEYILNNREHFSFIEQYANSPLVKSIIKEKGRSYFSTLEQFFIRGQEEGIIRDCHPVILHIFTFSPLFQIMKAHFKDGLDLNDEIIKDAFTMTWNSIRE